MTEFVSYAQNFEDVMLWRALKHVKNGYYIDIGAQDPISDSVSLAFYEHGWRGVHVEPTSYFADRLRAARPDEVVVQAAVTNEAAFLKFFEIIDTGLSTGKPQIAELHRAAGFSIREVEVPGLTLAQIFDLYSDRDIHWLKIDVEGMEREVLQGWMSSSVRPWLVVVESTVPTTAYESHTQWEPMLFELGYDAVYFDGLNRFYVSRGHAELKGAFGSGPNVFDGFVLSGTASAPFCRLLKDKLDEAQRTLRETREQVAVQLRHSQEAAERLAQAVAERESGLNALLEQKKQEVQRMSLVIQEQDRRIDALDRELSLIYRSWSWQITAPLRGVFPWTKGKSAIKSPAVHVARHASDSMRKIALSPLDALRRTYRASSLVFSAYQRFGARGLTDQVFRAIQRGGLLELRRTYGRFAVARATGSLPAAAESRFHAEKVSSGSGAEGLGQHGLRLGPDRGVDQPSWAQFLERLATASRGEQRTSMEQSHADQRLFVLIHAGPAANPNYLQKTLASIRATGGWTTALPVPCLLLDERLTNGSRFSIDEVTVYSALREFTAQLTDDDVVLFLRPGDEIHKGLVELLLHYCIDAAMTVVDLYFEECGRVYPLLMHAADPVHGVACDYFHSRYAMPAKALRRAVLQSNAGNPYEAAQFIFRDVLQGNSLRLAHVARPFICCALSREEVERCRKAIVARAEVHRSIFLKARSSGSERRSISVIINTKDKGNLLRKLVSELDGQPLIKEIVIVSNRTTNSYAIHTLAQLSKNTRVRVLRYDEPFNFSKQSNLAARYTSGETLLLMNDDVVPLTEGWLETLHSWFTERELRIVGPLLLYPDETVQHGGMFLGYNNVAGHTLRGCVLPDDDYGYLLTAPRRVSCLSGAVMLIHKRLFDSMNGLDPFLGTYLQDVDFCLRAINSGAELIFDPRAVLLHMESVSLAPLLHRQDIQLTRKREYSYFKARWDEEITRDLYFNPLFDKSDETLRSLRYGNSIQDQDSGVRSIE